MTATGTVKASLDSALPEYGGVTPDVRREMYANNGSEYVALVVFQVNSITVPADETEKDPAVKLKVLDIELAPTRGDNNWTRELIAAWHRKRTAGGTLEEGQDTADGAAATAKAVLTDDDKVETILGKGNTVEVNGEPVTTLRDLGNKLHLADA